METEKRTDAWFLYTALPYHCRQSFFYVMFVQKQENLSDIMMSNNDFTQLNKEKITSLLGQGDFSAVYEAADEVRRKNVGDEVHLRAIIEFSNVCRRQCIYCGLNCGNKELTRYRMTHEEIVGTARHAIDEGYRTIVLQSGEDDYFTKERIGRLIEDIKNTKAPFEPAVTLSIGERSRKDLEYFRRKGADRYLLKHETADRQLYDRLHPCGTLDERIRCLKTLKELGYETGSGFMTGLPGKSLWTVAEDLFLLKEIGCDMAGIGPFISNPKTPLKGTKSGEPELARRAVAIARLMLPKANLPVTTSLAVMSGAEAKCGQYENPFNFGANVIMKKVTPDKYKQAYEIYPARLNRTDIEAERRELERAILGYGRIPV